MNRHPLRAMLSVGLCVATLLQAIGCSTFRPLEKARAGADLPSGDTKLQVSVPSGFRYVFLANQYTLHVGLDSALSRVTGWGDQYGPYGLVDRGYFDIGIDDRTVVDVERVDPASTLLFTGALVGVGVATYIGIHSFSSQSSAKNGDRPSPPAGN